MQVSISSPASEEAEPAEGLDAVSPGDDRTVRFGGLVWGAGGRRAGVGKFRFAVHPLSPAPLYPGSPGLPQAIFPKERTHSSVFPLRSAYTTGGANKIHKTANIANLMQTSPAIYSNHKLICTPTEDPTKTTNTLQRACPELTWRSDPTYTCTPTDFPLLANKELRHVIVRAFYIIQLDTINWLPKRMWSH